MAIQIRQIVPLLLVMLIVTSPLALADGRAAPGDATGEVIVKLKPGADASALAMAGVQGKRPLLRSTGPHGNAHGLDRIHVLKVPPNREREMIARLNDHPLVEYAEPNVRVRLVSAPSDPEYAKLYGLHNTGQTGGTPDADIDAPEAWDIQRGNAAIVVAVIDTGVDYTHQDLVANVWTNPGEIAGNGIDDDANGLVDDVHGYDFFNFDGDPVDDDGHGTHVSGTIAAVGDNGIGVVGVSWNTSIMAVKFLDGNGDGYLTGAIDSINYATLMGADIMSNSWSGGGYSQALHDSINAANDAGILFVAAAGNDGVDNDVAKTYPASYALPNVVSVAATDHNDALAYFSSYGDLSVHLSAPGVSTYSTYPGGYATLSGTSMATPHVSGVAALILSQFPGMPLEELHARLVWSSDAIDSLRDKTITGGRLNAHSALQPDASAPAGIIDAQAGGTGLSWITLSWTAAGDDGSTGSARAYDVRYSESPIDDLTWAQASRATGEHVPATAGAAETFAVQGLEPNTTYHLAIKAIDDAGKESPLSNVVSARTPAAEPLVSYDMESGPEGWTAAGLWHLETYRSSSPDTSWAFNTGAPSYNYDAGVVAGTLTSPPLDLRAHDSAHLSLAYLYQTETTGSTYDKRTVQIGVNGTFTDFTQLHSDEMLVWNDLLLDISQHAGQDNVQVRFVFDSVDSSLNAFEGWYIDDVRVLVAAEPAIPNEAPTAHAGGPYTGMERETVAFNASASSDPDGDSLTYRWSFGDGTIATGAVASHAYASEGNYSVTLEVSDGRDVSTDTTVAMIEDANDAPVAVTQGDRMVSDADGDGMETVALDATASYDVDGTIVSYVWSDAQGAIGSGAMTTGAFAVGTHDVTLTVTDDGNATGTAQSLVTVLANAAPAADAGADQTIAATSADVRLDGSASSDPDGTLASHEWSEDGIVIATGMAPTVTLGEGVHTIALTVTDNGGLKASDTVTVTVQLQERDAVLAATDGYDSKSGQTLAAAGAIPTVTASDDVRWSTQPGQHTAYSFADIPAGAIVQSVVLRIEHLEDGGFDASRLRWSIGTGWPAAPQVWASIPGPVSKGKQESMDAWDVTAHVDTAEKLNALELFVGNSDKRKSTSVDHVQVVVKYLG